MKKLISVAIAAILTLGTGGALASQGGGTASACELPGCSQTAAHTHSVCAVTYCTQPVNHEHDGVIYYAHHEADGHGHQPAAPAATQASYTQANVFQCDISGCPKTDDHSHTVCNNEDCTLTSDHSHNGEMYYGHSEVDGHGHSNGDTANNTVDLAVIDTVNNTVSADTPFKCDMPGCGKTEAHNHMNCTVVGCNQMTNHEHDGILYYGHSSGDGHAYHDCGIPIARKQTSIVIIPAASADAAMLKTTVMTIRAVATTPVTAEVTIKDW